MVPYRRINWSLSYFLIGKYSIPTWLEDWKKLECIVIPVPINCKFVFFFLLFFFLAMHTTSASIQKNATQFWNVQTVNYIISVMPFIYTYLEMKYFHIFFILYVFLVSDALSPCITCWRLIVNLSWISLIVLCTQAELTWYTIFCRMNSREWNQIYIYKILLASGA